MSRSLRRDRDEDALRHEIDWRPPANCWRGASWAVEDAAARWGVVARLEAIHFKPIPRRASRERKACGEDRSRGGHAIAVAIAVEPEKRGLDRGAVHRAVLAIDVAARGHRLSARSWRSAVLSAIEEMLVDLQRAGTSLSARLVACEVCGTRSLRARGSCGACGATHGGTRRAPRRFLVLQACSNAWQRCAWLLDEAIPSAARGAGRPDSRD